MVVLGSGVNGWDDRTPARLSSLVPELPVGEPLVYVQPEMEQRESKEREAASANNPKGFSDIFLNLRLSPVCVLSTVHGCRRTRLKGTQQDERLTLCDKRFNCSLSLERESSCLRV